MKTTFLGHSRAQLQAPSSLWHFVYTCVCTRPCVYVLMQSPQHVDIAEVFADQCRESLERSPCKDIFSNCRKWVTLPPLTLTCLRVSHPFFSVFNLPKWSVPNVASCRSYVLPTRAVHEYLSAGPFEDYQNSMHFDRFLQWKVLERYGHKLIWNVFREEEY